MQAVILAAALLLAAVLVLVCINIADRRRASRLPPLPEDMPEDAQIRETLAGMGTPGICRRCRKRVNPMEKTCPHCGETLTASRMKSFGGRGLHGERELIDEVNRWLYANRSAIRVRADFSTAVLGGGLTGREVLSRVILSFEVAGVKRTEDYVLVAPKRHSLIRVRDRKEMLQGLLRRFPDARIVSCTGYRGFEDEEDALASFLRPQTVYALICLPRGSAVWGRRRSGKAPTVLWWILAALLFLSLLAGIWLRVTGVI